MANITSYGTWILNGDIDLIELCTVEDVEQEEEENKKEKDDKDKINANLLKFELSLGHNNLSPSVNFSSHLHTEIKAPPPDSINCQIDNWLLA